MRHSREKGLTILELLIVMGIIAVLAGMAIANYFSALTRAKQKRTVSDIRTIALAWEARAAETHSYVAAGYTFPGDHMVTYASLQRLLVPAYAKTLPQVDGWGRPLQFAATADATGQPGSYAIRSGGRDGVYDATYANGATNDPDCDIVYSDGNFVAYPDVVQTH
ncbi:MAG TPA: type II secretion system protein [Thermoanaerobaculia bacterium]|nr:type II secretion system protein [Thermoanaerobaculia bacterium]